MLETLKKQHYVVVGNHSAVKPCLWLKKSIRGEGICYKQKFYGIESHRCMQMTPSVGWCNHACVFCWRNTEQSMGTQMSGFDDPKKILDEAITAHQQALSGFGGSEAADKKKLAEALDPRHVAISLAGEPTLYEPLGELIGEIKRRDMTSYLVTNGTRPDRLSRLSNLPTQLYMSLVAADIDTYKRVCNPQSPGLWDKINESLSLYPCLSTRKVIRLTLVKDLNMRDVKAYARLIEGAQPDFIEAKAYMFVGGSRKRLSMDNMPSHDEVKDFSYELAKHMSYKVCDEKTQSRVVLLGK